MNIQESLKHFIDPYLETDWISANALLEVSDGDVVEVKVTLGYPGGAFFEQLAQDASQFLSEMTGKPTVVTLEAQIVSHEPQPNVQGLTSIKNIIAVGSGKGGVGKSTTAVHMALALAAQGAKVGILDADIYGPSLPTMLGLHGQPETLDQKSILPMQRFGIEAMSIGFLLDDVESPLVWRGPMVSTALQQLLRDTKWGNLDYLFIDLPPGTGDIQLTLAQKIPVSGAVVVTTPQELSLIDARKAVMMFQKLHVPVLGVVENMSGYVCPNCQHQVDIFSHGGGAVLSQAYHVPLLGQIPLLPHIRDVTDKGELLEPESDAAKAYQKLALKTAAALSRRPRDLTSKFGKIVLTS